MVVCACTCPHLACSRPWLSPSNGLHEHSTRRPTSLQVLWPLSPHGRQTHPSALCLTRGTSPSKCSLSGSLRGLSCAGCDQNITRSPRCTLLVLAHHQHTRIPPPGYPQCHPSERWPHNCSLATPKHNYVRHYDTCRSRCANNWSITSNVFDRFTRSPAALSPPGHLNPTLRLTCPTCGHSACSRQNTNCLDPIRHTTSYCSLRPSISPVVCLRCPLGPTSRPLKLYRMDGASLSHSPQLKYSHWSHRNLLG